MMERQLPYVKVLQLLQYNYNCCFIVSEITALNRQ